MEMIRAWMIGNFKRSWGGSSGSHDSATPIPRHCEWEYGREPHVWWGSINKKTAYVIISSIKLPF